MIYSIYHPVGGSMNHDCKCATYMYEHVFTLEASSFDEAFKLSQNDFNDEYAAQGYRSTSVGDIIQSVDDYEKGVCHLVKDMGFMEVSNTWLSFIDWGVVDSEQEEFNSQGLRYVNEEIGFVDEDEEYR